MTIAETQIKECQYRLKAARAKIRKLSKQVETEQEALKFWRDHQKKAAKKDTLIKEDNSGSSIDRREK